MREKKGSISSEELQDLDDLIEEEKQVKGGAFQSPIMKKTQRQLDINLLRSEIPHFQDGKKAREILQDDNLVGALSDEEKDDVYEKYRRGQEAKETLYLAALPLIKIIAHKEWKRRQQWASQIPYEDLIQDATLGFLKGLEAFKVESIDRSSTNYLGQWMLVEMRRSSEGMDHDLQVSNEAGERFRRIRALRTRLTQELDREPTDEEIAEASRNPDYITRPTMVGRAKKEGERHAAGKGVTVKQVQMEREAQARVGTVSRFVPTDSDKDTRPAPGTIDPERSKDTGLISHDPADIIAEENSQKVVAVIVQKVITEMGLPDEQKAVISLRYGLPPHDKEHSIREISTTTEVSRARITKILNAFSGEMTSPGGTFHKFITHLYTVEELIALDLSWLMDALGPWDKSYEKVKRDVPKILTGRQKRSSTTEGGSGPGGVGDVGLQKMRLQKYSTETQAWYHCDFHNRTFSRLYENRRSVPRTSPCPSCDKSSKLIRTHP